MADDSDGVDRCDPESQKSDKMFTLKKWNAVAMWSWDVECDTCAICRVQVMGKCYTVISCVVFEVMVVRLEVIQIDSNRPSPDTVGWLVFPDVYLQDVAIQEECSLLCSVIKFSTSYFRNDGYWPSTGKRDELLFLSKASPLCLKVL